MTFLRHRRDSTFETPSLLYALQATIIKERAEVDRSKSARTMKRQMIQYLRAASKEAKISLAPQSGWRSLVLPEPRLFA